MNIFIAETGENLGQIENIKEVNITSESKTDYARDKHNNIVTRVVYEPTYTMTFDVDKSINTEEFYRILGIDLSNMPDAYDIQFIKFVQARKNKKKRINKKWRKRYGYKQIIVDSKGWKIKSNVNGNVEFIK